jgi:hypothetical protein
VSENYIDEMIPSEADQASFALGLKEALRLFLTYLPEGASEEIHRKLVGLRAVFEDVDLGELAEHFKCDSVDLDYEPPDYAAALAVGMVDYWLFRIQHERGGE